MVTQERLKELLDYDSGTGEFTWRVGRGVALGSVAGCVSRNGYLNIRIDGKLYLAHRLAWLYIYGEFPPDQLDHVNRVKADNRILNLRPATQAENMQNYSKPRNNTSGVTGVHWHKQHGKWQASIRLNGHGMHLGYFKTIEDAAAAREAAKAKLHTFNPEDNNEKTT